MSSALSFRHRITRGLKGALDAPNGPTDRSTARRESSGRSTVLTPLGGPARRKKGWPGVRPQMGPARFGRRDFARLATAEQEVRESGQFPGLSRRAGFRARCPIALRSSRPSALLGNLLERIMSRWSAECRTIQRAAGLPASLFQHTRRGKRVKLRSEVSARNRDSARPRDRKTRLNERPIFLSGEVFRGPPGRNGLLC